MIHLVKDVAIVGHVYLCGGGVVGVIFRMMTPRRETGLVMNFFITWTCFSQSRLGTYIELYEMNVFIKYLF